MTQPGGLVLLVWLYGWYGLPSGCHLAAIWPLNSHPWLLIDDHMSCLIVTYLSESPVMHR